MRKAVDIMRIRGGELRFGFVGAGRITSALVSRLVGGGLVKPEQVILCDICLTPHAREIVETYGVELTLDKPALISRSDVVIIAVKPQDIGAALCGMKPHLRRRQIIITLAAAVSIGHVQAALGPHVQVIRAMPNTSCGVGQAATALCYSANATARSRTIARTFFSAVGKTFDIDEHLFDAVTGLSGSGPAFIYYVAQAMQAAGVRLGLPSDTARDLVCQTLLGAGVMISETRRDPGYLLDQVASPKGTTVAGLAVLDGAGVARHFEEAIIRAAERSAEIRSEVNAARGRRAPLESGIIQG